MSRRYIVKLDNELGNLKLDSEPEQSGNKVYTSINGKKYHENINTYIETVINNKAEYTQRSSAGSSVETFLEIQEDQRI